MNFQKPHFKPRFTPIPPDIDIPTLVHSQPNFQWCHREDARLHSSPFQKLNQIIHTITIEHGLPIVVDNWHLRNDWNAALFSKEWLDREYDILVRDLVKGLDISMSTSLCLSQIPILAGQDFTLKSDSREKPPRRHYAKDIDCPQEWRNALAELLPREISYLGDNDLMTKLPPEARAENMMIYIGHEGTYTPAHKDMCATNAQNIMVATSPSPRGVEGLTYWFVFSARDRKRVADYWNTLGHDIDTEHFFASIEDLKGFPGNVYVIEQRIGDLVVIPPLGAHQVYNHGGMTIKAAWNRTTIDTLELSLSETLPAYRHVCRDEQYKNKAIVHQSLLELSRFPPQSLISSPFKHDSFMRLFRLYTTLLVDEFIPADLYTTITCMEKIPQQFNVLCSFCRTNIWNRFLTCRACLQLDVEGEIDSYDICLECFARGRSCRDITNLEWVQQEKWSGLMSLWERCRGIYQFLGGEDIDDFHTETSISLGRKTLAGVCVEELLRRPSPHKLGGVLPEGHCHTCKTRHPNWKMVYCTSEKCNRAYCFGNLFRQFDEDPFDILSKLEGYKCPVCRGICNCGSCRKRKDQIGYEPKLRSVVINPKLVADRRSIESLVGTHRTNTRWHLETKGTLSAKNDTATETDRETSSDVFEDIPDIPEAFHQDRSLDPALLDPEMSNYLFGQPSHGPPPYSEVEPHVESPADNHKEFSQRLLVDQPELPWTSPYDNSLENYISRPLSAPILHPDLLSPHSTGIFPTMINDDRSKSISPSMLNKSSSISVQDEVIWYSSGKEMQIGGKRPPHTKYGGEGKGKGNVLGKRRMTMDDLESQRVDDRPIRDVSVERTRYEVNVETGLDSFKRIKLIFYGSSTTTPPPDTSRPPDPCTNPVEAEDIPQEKPDDIPQEKLDDIPQEKSDDIPQEKSEDIPQEKPDDILREKSDDILQAKSDDIPQEKPDNIPQEKPDDTPQEKPDDILQAKSDDIPQEKSDDTLQEKSEEQDIAQADVFPPAAIEPCRSPPSAPELILDEKTPPPTVSTERICNFDIIIPRREIDKSMYPVFLGKDAKQTMVRRKHDGTIKGFMFQW